MIATVTISQKVPGGKYVARATHRDLCEQSSKACETKEEAYEYIKRLLLNYGYEANGFTFRKSYSSREVKWKSPEHEKECLRKWLNS